MGGLDDDEDLIVVAVAEPVEGHEGSAGRKRDDGARRISAWPHFFKNVVSALAGVRR
jgi:hypothetical protein